MTESRSVWREDELTVSVVSGRNPTVRPRCDTSAVYRYLLSRNRGLSEDNEKRLARLISSLSHDGKEDKYKRAWEE